MSSQAESTTPIIGPVSPVFAPPSSCQSKIIPFNLVENEDNNMHFLVVPCFIGTPTGDHSEGTENYEIQVIQYPNTYYLKLAQLEIGRKRVSKILLPLLKQENEQKSKRQKVVPVEGDNSIQIESLMKLYDEKRDCIKTNLIKAVSDLEFIQAFISQEKKAKHNIIPFLISPVSPSQFREDKFKIHYPSDPKSDSDTEEASDSEESESESEKSESSEESSESEEY